MFNAFLRPLARFGLPLLLVPALLGEGQAQTAPRVSSSAPAQLVFDEVNDLLQTRYGGLSTVDRRALQAEYQQRLDTVCEPEPVTCAEDKAYPVLEAELAALGDHHSFFQLPDEYRDFLASASGGTRQQFGVKLARLDGENRLVLEVVPQGAAEAAGLRRGDVIRTLDGAPYVYTDLQAARVQGRKLRLGVERQGQTLEISMQARQSSTRDLPRLSFVGPQKNVALIRIPTFLAGGGVGQQVHDMVAQAQRVGAKGVVVDLRGNTGGSLNECDSAVAAFVPSFTRIARSGDGDNRLTVSRGRRLEDGKLRQTVNRPQLWTGPVSVLVNEGSASCSEFFAYEVQYAGRGPVVGELTSGVGNTATRVLPVGHGAAVQLTVTHYVKPGGGPYPNQVTPDRVVGEGEEEMRRLSQGEDVMLEQGILALETAPTLTGTGQR